MSSYDSEYGMKRKKLSLFTSADPEFIERFGAPNQRRGRGYRPTFGRFSWKTPSEIWAKRGGAPRLCPLDPPMIYKI